MTESTKTKEAPVPRSSSSLFKADCRPNGLWQAKRYMILFNKFENLEDFERALLLLIFEARQETANPAYRMFQLLAKSTRDRTKCDRTNRRNVAYKFITVRFPISKSSDSF